MEYLFLNLLRSHKQKFNERFLERVLRLRLLSCFIVGSNTNISALKQQKILAKSMQQRAIQLYLVKYLLFVIYVFVIFALDFQSSFKAVF